MLCSVDMRSLPPSQFGDSDDLQIVGIPTMRLQKNKYLGSLHQELSDKTSAFIRSIKQGSRLKLYPPPHRVTGTQFRKWSQMENGMMCKINMALCIRLRPWDGIFLELFA
ncbi:hypothetical protein R1sor_024657 [Riccia sorocarpa]|uniref:Uncharacterized protein n=1 Tax=Riccia sorocarpa TaxID=122646 RepID=A0ABD3GV67_9MARC